MNKFIYSENPLITMEQKWIDLIGISKHSKKTNTINSYIVEVPPLNQIINSLKEVDDFSIESDCRFFALLIGSLQEQNDINQISIFFMHNCYPVIEPKIPENCLYITLDSDIFTTGEKSGNPTILSLCLGASQGQWIVKQKNKTIDDEERYVGLVSGSVLVQSLDDWCKRYTDEINAILETIPKHSNNTLPDMNTLTGLILNTKIKMHGVQLSIYRFTEYGTPEKQIHRIV